MLVGSSCPWNLVKLDPNKEEGPPRECEEPSLLVAAQNSPLQARLEENGPAAPAKTSKPPFRPWCPQAGGL